LQCRRTEIEQAILTRVYSISDPTETDDPEYLAGLKEAVSIAIDYSCAGIDGDEAHLRRVPVELLAQARRAARSGVGLDVVLRRYFAGYTLLSEFLIQEARGNRPLAAEEVRLLSRVQATIFDRLVAAVTEEHRSEAGDAQRTSAGRRLERVRRQLAGDLIDPEDLGYDLDGSHLGVLATGAGASRLLRRQATVFGCRFLLVCPGGDTVWAWLGRSRPLAVEDLLDAITTFIPGSVSIAVGEPAEGFSGWRLSHLQASAALPIARLGPGRPVRYADVALLASAHRDEVLAKALEQAYLAPLRERDGDGTTLHRTMRIYFETGGNASSTAAALGVARQTVNRRLRLVEERIGRPLESCAAELQIALRLGELGSHR
jgi:hypothetical protein